MLKSMADQGEGAKPIFLDQIRVILRTRHYCLRTEDLYLSWIRRFILFEGKRHPQEMGEAQLAFHATAWIRISQIGLPAPMGMTASSVDYDATVHRLRIGKVHELTRTFGRVTRPKRRLGRFTLSIYRKGAKDAAT